MRVLLSLSLSFFAAISLAAKSKDQIALPAAPVTMSDFNKLGIALDQSMDLNLFSQNMGLRLDAKSSVRNVFYASRGLAKWVFVQAHLAVADKPTGEITTLPDGKSFFSIRGATNFFVLTKGFERDQLFQLRKNIETNLSRLEQSAFQIPFATPKWVFADWLLRAPNSNAAKTCISSQEIQQKAVTSSDDDYKILKAYWACEKGKGQGLWNATGGAVTATYDVITKGSEQILCGAASLVNAAWDRCSDYAAAMQNTIDSSLYTFGNVKQVAGEMIDDFKELPIETQIQVYCEMKSTVEASVAVSLLTAGTGAPAGFTRMAQVLNRVAETQSTTKSSAVLRSMAAKLERKAQDKAAALASVKAIPQDLKESLGKIDNFKSELAQNSTKVSEYSKALDLKWKEVENNPSRYATETLLRNAEKHFESLLQLNRSTKTEDIELASQLLKYAKLTRRQKDLANQVLASGGSRVAKHEADDAIIKLAQSVKDSRITIREDIKFATSEDHSRLTRDYIALEEKRMRANRAVASAKQKLSDEISHYWALIEKKNISPQDKDILKAQVSAYMTATLCSASESISATTKGVSSENGVR